MAHCYLNRGKSRKKRTRGLRTRRHVKSNRHRKKRRRGGGCGCGPQTGGSALLNAVVPASILLALSRFTKTNRRRTKKQRKSRRKRR
tara:strand:+ start:336 stop:596 length:261 start_codon:yes stop_codon:yes gene_type:complete